MAVTKVSLKLFVDKKRQRVIFAEADKEFVDFLLSIFTLPVGVVTRLLKEGGVMAGSLPSLYQSIENLSATYIQPNKNKHFVLEPKVVMPGAKVPLLFPNVASTFRQLYRCPNNKSNCSCYVADNDSIDCPSCKYTMCWTVECLDPEGRESCSKEGYVKGAVTYMVMDDLEVKALCTSSVVTLVSKFNVDDIEEKVVDFGMDEGVKLLEVCLQSKTVLTDVFLIKAESVVKVESTWGMPNPVWETWNPV